MIHYLNRKEIDIAKYDACIDDSLNSRIYAYSWYLDIVADNWDALVLDDYKAVMPLPWRSKYFIKYVYAPFWVLQLGVFSKINIIDVDPFLKILFKKFRYVNLRMNAGNFFQEYPEKRIINQMQFLNLKNTYEMIFSNYSRNRKRDCKKAAAVELKEIWNDNPEKLIDLFKKNVGMRVSKLQESDYQILLNLMKACVDKNLGEMLSIYTKKDSLIAIAFFLKHKFRVTELVCTTDFQDRDNGANTYMNDRAIYKYQKEFEFFNFGGSSMKNISNYYKSFDADTENYSLLNFNNLPFLLRLFKK